MTDRGWIGFDLDGTIAYHGGGQGPEHIGLPIPPMIAIMRLHLAQGWEVRIMTARVGPQGDPDAPARARAAIERWCLEVVGQVLPVTHEKDYRMVRMYDDRAAQVIPNKGILLEVVVDELRAEVARLRARLEKSTTTPRIGQCMASMGRAGRCPNDATLICTIEPPQRRSYRVLRCAKHPTGKTRPIPSP